MKKLIGISIWGFYSLCMASMPITNGYWKSAGQEIDRLVEIKLKANDSQLAPAVGEDLFLRRSYLSLIGRIPNVKEVEAFRAMPEATRRDELIDSLLASPGFDSHIFNFWADLLRLKENIPGIPQAGIPYVMWIKEQIKNNTPYDKMIYEMIVSHGDTWNKGDGATGFYRRDAGMALDHFALTMQTFSGIQMQCAQCHNHPFEKWTQKEFYEMAAFLNMRQNAFSTNAVPIGKIKTHYKEEFKITGATRQTLRSAYNSFNDVLGKSIPDEGKGKLNLPKDYQYDDAKPKALITARTIMGEELVFDPKSSEENSRVVFAKWLTSPEHEYFTRVIVNRLWKYVMGVGLYEPVDDIREDTVIDNEPLMAYLEDQLKFFDYDLKKFFRLIHSTSVFSREAQVYATDTGQPFRFEGPLMRRMSSEQIWDSMMTLRQADIDSIKSRQRKGFYSAYNVLTQMDREQVIEFVDGLVEAQSDQGQSRGGINRQLVALGEGMAYNPTASEDSMMMSMSPSDQITTLYGDMPPALITLQKHPEVKQKVRNLHGKHKGFQKSKNTQKADEAKELAVKAMESIGLTEKDLMTCFRFFKRVDKANTEKLKYARASELGSPAPKGHFLRIFGASDREYIDNGSREGSTPQALEMMNGFVNWGVLQQPQSVLARNIKNLKLEESVDYLYLALLTRSPTPVERDHLLKFSEGKSWSNKRDMAWAIVNGPEFSFYY